MRVFLPTQHQLPPSLPPFQPQKGPMIDGREARIAKGEKKQVHGPNRPYLTSVGPAPYPPEPAVDSTALTPRLLLLRTAAMA